MTQKEKAEELFNNMCNANYGFIYELDKEPYNTAKQCALIAVDEILNLSYFTYDPTEDDDLYGNYWREVRNEIEKL
jgi:hypothetical protein